MKKHVLIILAAGLLLLSATACNKDKEDNKETDGATDTAETTGGFFIVDTDEYGEPVTSGEPNGDFEEVTEPDPSEESPTFTDVNMEIVIISYGAQIRSSTQIKADNTVAWPSGGTTYTATGVSENWYRIKYQDQDCYVAKNVAADAAVLNTFTAIEGGEMVKVVNAETVNVRSYPSADSKYSIRDQLTGDTEVKRLATNGSWSLIEYQGKSESETNADGSAMIVTKQGYIKNSFLEALASEEETTEPSTETDTEGTTEGAADAQ